MTYSAQCHRWTN